MWLLQKNLPAIVVVFVYAKQIMALGRRKKNSAHSSHSFHPLIINGKGDGLETFFFLPFMPHVCPTFQVMFSAFVPVWMFKSSVSKCFLGLPRGGTHTYLVWSYIAL